MLLGVIVLVTLDILSVTGKATPNVDETNEGASIYGSEIQSSQQVGRSKRSLPNLYNMMERTLPCTKGLKGSFVYNGHGNWCGSGGSGNTIDGIDECCRDHDYCYANKTKCGSSLKEYTSNYDWTLSYGSRPDSLIITCNDRDFESCKFMLCECDVKFIRCLQKQPCP
nr:PREDICTED: basic phospholipase A2 pseudexin A chain [Bemisia tabaci]